MILKIAWKNIWRSRTRSWVVIGAIILGIWSLIFMLSFSEGMINSYVSNAIQNEVSHIQLHPPEFLEDREVQYYFGQIATKVKTLNQTPNVKAVTVRSFANGMLSTSNGVRGIQIRGVDPQKEAKLTKLDQKVVDGAYFNNKRKNQVLISKRIAEKLKVKVRSKVVLTFQTLDQEITSAAFRIMGLFDSGSTIFDEANLIVKQEDLNRLLGQPNIGHEIALLINNIDSLNQTKQSLSTQFADLKVETYREISPDLELYESQMQTSATIFIVIIMLALVFGIINTMLMAVLERYKELGMLMAVGMNKLRVFTMIVAETIMLALIALLPGLLLGYLTVQYFGRYGIDLSAFSKGLKQFGMSEMVYTSLSQGFYIQLALSVCITGVVASIYPALKAIRLRPVEAIRKI